MINRSNEQNDGWIAFYSEPDVASPAFDCRRAVQRPAAAERRRRQMYDGHRCSGEVDQLAVGRLERRREVDRKLIFDVKSVPSPAQRCHVITQTYKGAEL